MIVGVPKEIMAEEGRVALLPAQVKELMEKKHFQVLVETGAGASSLADDRDYLLAGADIIEDVRELYARSQVILKVKEPQYNPKLGAYEIDLMGAEKILVAFLHPAAPDNYVMVRKLGENGITAFSMDLIPRISRAQSMDALSSMSTIAGYKAVLAAANVMPRFVPMMTTAAGMIPPAKFLVIGAGVAGLQATATARRLGAVVSCIDIRAAAREAGRSLGAKDAGWEVPADIGETEGGYAKALPWDWLIKEQQIIAQAARDADVIILSALVQGEKAPVLVTKDAIAGLKPGTVIVDISVDQGGNCELTRAGEEYLTGGGIYISGIKNLPGRMPAHASLMYSKNMLNFLLNLFKSESDEPDLEDEINRLTLVTRQGKIMHQGALRSMTESKV